jgi:hypothetical protein
MQRRDGIAEVNREMEIFLLFERYHVGHGLPPF